jgi:hypothetical protein
MFKLVLIIDGVKVEKKMVGDKLVLLQYLNFAKDFLWKN